MQRRKGKKEKRTEKWRQRENKRDRERETEGERESQTRPDGVIPYEYIPHHVTLHHERGTGDERHASTPTHTHTHTQSHKRRCLPAVSVRTIYVSCRP